MRDAVFLLSAAKRASERGDAAEAERLWRSILAKDPGNAGAARAFGEALVDSFRYQEAFDIVGAAARRQPLDRELRLLMGQCLYGVGRIAQAYDVLQGVVNSDAGSVRGRVAMALCLTAMNRAQDALARVQPLLTSAPDDRLVNFAAGHTYLQLGKGREGAEYLRRATRSWPNPQAIGELGWALYNDGRRDEAAAEFDRAHAINPNVPTVIAGRASLLIDARAHDEARAMLGAAVEKFPIDAQLLALYARVAKTPEQRASVRVALERAIGVSQQPSSRASCFYSLGSLKEADGDFDGAFECFRQANAVNTAPFDVSVVEGATRAILGVFTRENMARMPRGPQSELPVFILGMPRSGTSLVEQILASHPAVYGAGELSDLPALATGIPARFHMAGVSFPTCVHGLTQAQVNELAAAYLDRLRELGGAALRVTDKMPRNYLFCGLIDVLFPGAKIVHCVRHPLDTCVSIYATPLSQGHQYRARLSDLAAVYRDYRRAMDHWKGVLRLPILEVRYEELVADQAGGSRRLIEFVGLPWDDRCLSFHENSRPVVTASADQVRRPIYTNSVARWKRYEKHIGELIEGLRGYL